MTVYSDNAAGRLHEVITKFINNYSGSSPVLQVWAAALGMRVDDPALLRSLSRVFRLPVEILHELGLVDSEEYDEDFALRWRDTIPNGLRHALLIGKDVVEDIPTVFDDASLSSLEYCSFVLHRHRPQRVLTSTELNRIKDLIVELRTEVLNDAGMDPSLRDFLLLHERAMWEALQDLPVRGPVALEQAFDRTVGAMTRRMDLTVELQSHSGAWTKFSNLMMTVAAVLTIATTGFVLPGQIRQELDGPSPAQPTVVKIIKEPANEAGRSTPDVQQRSEKASESSGSH